LRKREDERGGGGRRDGGDGKERRTREEHRLSKVQSSGHGAGYYMGFWVYGGGGR